MLKNILLAGILAAGLVTIVTPSRAEDPAPASRPAAGARRHPLEPLREAVEKLNLSDDQKDKVHKIVEASREKLKPILEAAKNGDRDKAREEVRAIVKDTLKEISEVLTPEQKEKLKALMEEKRAEHPQRQRPAGN